MNCYTYINALNVALAIVAGLLHTSNAQTLSTPSGFASRGDYLKSLTNEVLITAAYQEQFISKDEASQAISNQISSLHFTSKEALHEAYDKGIIGRGMAMALELMMENHQAQNHYGRVIDQNGQPVAGVEVEGIVELMDGFVVGKMEKHKTQTDMEGLFQFVGLTGASLSANVSKPGYVIDYRVGRSKPVEGQSSPNDRVIYIMCKLHGGEPMKHFQLDSDVPCDGGIVSFDLLTGKKTPAGDLIVKLTRNPIIIDRRKPFDWSVTMAITNGGLQTITNLYPNEAPVAGYQPSLTLDFPADMVGWKKEINNSYYFKSKGGQVYGRIAVHILADRPQPPTYFDAEIYANPAGSRNLEFDPQKRIR